MSMVVYYNETMKTFSVRESKHTLYHILNPIGHFIVMDGDEAEGDLVLIQTFLLYYVNQVILMLTSIFQEQFP